MMMIKYLKMKMSHTVAFLLLSTMFLLSFYASLDDATTFDETAHTPAGYSYIVRQDYRLNPEHPPLLKDLAGLSVWLGSQIMGRDLNFPDNIDAWQKDLNGQWVVGNNFLFKSGNDADTINLLARLPMLLIMILLGYYVYRWTRELYGNKAGLLALFFYSFSPTFIAHGHYVTTDVGAAAAFFISTYYLIKWLKSQRVKDLLKIGVVFGLALVTKFSLALLIPYFAGIVFFYVLINFKMEKTLDSLKPILGLMLIGLIGLAVIYPIYAFNTYNYPYNRQLSDADANLSTYGNRLHADPVIWMNKQEILRPYGQYFTGLLMMVQRKAGGNTTYYYGMVDAKAWPSYFPIVFMIKVPLALLAFLVFAFIYFLYDIKNSLFAKPAQKVFAWLKTNFDQFALFCLFVLYWYISITGNLNIGVRHVLPTFPILYLLISGQVARAFHQDAKISNPKRLPFFFNSLIILGLLIWYAYSCLSVAPFYLTHFNELVGGPQNGHVYVTDSNLDWGQDLKRLARWAEKNNVNTIYLDYFGGDCPECRLADKFQPWWGTRLPSDLPANSWLAISATLLQGGRGTARPDFDFNEGYYRWLDNYQPTTVIGNSIFVYQIP